MFCRSDEARSAVGVLRRGGPLAAAARVELHRGEAGIEPSLLDELLVSSTGDDAALVDDDDAPGLLDRGEAVGDDDRRAPGHQALQRSEEHTSEPQSLMRSPYAGF